MTCAAVCDPQTTSTDPLRLFCKQAHAHFWDRGGEVEARELAPQKLNF